MAKPISKLKISLILLLFPVMAVFAAEAQAGGPYSKKAYNITQGRDAQSVTARPGDIIEYTLTYYNSTGSIQTVTIEDNLDNVLQWADIYRINEATLSGTLLRFPAATVQAGTYMERSFQVRIKSNLQYSGSGTMNNNYGNQVSIAIDTGNTYYYGSTDRWQSAYNQTQNVNAQSVYAQPGDIIQYTLSYENHSSYSQSVSLEVNLNDVLQLADIFNYNGATLSGNVLRFPSVTVGAGSRIDRSFQVRVRSIPAGITDTVMSSYFGNNLDIHINTSGGYVNNYQIVKGAYTAPATGPEGFAAAIPAGISTLGYFFLRRRKKQVV